MTTSTHSPRHRKIVAPGASRLAGTGTMIRLALRRDRFRLPAWIAGHGLLVLYIGSALPQLAPTKEDLAGITSLLAQPVGRMFTGPAFGMDDVTYERFFAAGYVPYLFILAALMNIMLVIRHIRKEEQTGRAELIRASVTGRHTVLTATLVVAALANVTAGALVVLLAIALDFALVGSLLVGLATALTGFAFAGVASLTAQLSEFSRSATGMAGAVLGVAFVLRALGDMISVGGSALSWASPLGWAAQTAPYVEDRWGPLVFSAAFAAVTIVLAFALQRRRDFGASLFPPRPGSARAAPSLGHPVGLALRLQRGGLLGWGAAILTLGVIDGLFTQSMLDAGEDMPPQLSAVFGSEQLLDGYIGFLGAFMGVFVAAYVVHSMQTLNAEEGTGRAEAVLATPVSRIGWLGAHSAVIALGAIVITLVTGVGTGIAAAAVTGEGELVGSIVLAHIAVLPAPLTVLGLCTTLFGLLPRLVAPVGWVLVAVLGIVELFADLLDLPEWFRMVSPMWHLASLPVEELDATAFTALVGVTLVAFALGLAGVRRRQVNVA